MPYYLKHYFDPDFDYLNLHPREREDGSVDHYDMGYVQNVLKGQLLAKWIKIADNETEGRNFKYISAEKMFPMGAGTAIDPDDPTRLIADCNGYVFYAGDKIAVKNMLNVRRDVDFNTGNIRFVGDLTVHGLVRSGFKIEANHITVKRQVENARVVAHGDLTCETGVKGGGDAYLEAGESIKLPFCENATLNAGKHVVVKDSSLHSDIFAGKKLAVGNKLIGGQVHVSDYAYIGEQLGGGMNAETAIIGGFDPRLLYADRVLNSQIADLNEKLEQMEAYAEKSDELETEYRPKIIAASERLKVILNRKERLWYRIGKTDRSESCKIVVPGKVRPGVEISIGKAYLKVDDFLEDVFFYLEDMEIKIGSPAPEPTGKQK